MSHSSASSSSLTFHHPLYLFCLSLGIAENLSSCEWIALKSSRNNFPLWFSCQKIILTRFEQIMGDYIKTPIWFSFFGCVLFSFLNVITYLCFNLYDILSFFRVGKELNIFVGAPANKKYWVEVKWNNVQWTSNQDEKRWNIFKHESTNI